MSDNKLYIAAAGAGKTTFLVHHACDLAKDDNQKSIAIITYTRKNQQEIKNRFISAYSKYAYGRAIPIGYVIPY